MGTNERRERERSATRAKILDAARDLFLEHGFEAVTMRKVADKIEYTPTAIYFHFKDKEALVRELCVNDFLALATKFMKIGKEVDPIERLKKVGQAYAEFGIAHPNHYRLMFMSEVKQVSGVASNDELKGHPESDAYAFLRWTVGEALEQDRLRPELKDAELVTQLVWSAMHGMVALEIAKGKDPWITWKPIKDRVRGMIALILLGVVKDVAPLKRPRSKKERREAMVDLALKTLLHDKLRFAITVAGVAFAVTLVLVQVGLFMGLLDNASVTIDHTDADLWITSKSTPNVDFSHAFPESRVQRVQSIEGVARAENLIVQFMNMSLPSGAEEVVVAYALEDFRGWNIPWNIVEGDLEDLRRGDYMFMDESSVRRFGAFEVGSYREVSGQRLKIIGRTRGAKSFTTTPVVFMSYALVQSLQPRLQASTTYTLVKLAPGANVEAVRREIKTRLPFNDVYTKAEWSARSRSYWVANTGIGFNMYITVFLGCLVGIVVVAQTLYTSTMEHLKEFGTVKAIGGSNLDIYKILARQAGISAVVGFVVGLAPSFALGPIILAKADLKLIISPAFMGIVFVGTVAMCLLASMIPFRKVASIDPGLVFRG